ncbi:RNase adapter RapZ [Granulosicoccus antarcticus]|uniref:RNase adapter protein RapZ n=1 Tax=Granulosicoccus antarcticus IMCC3135 TaxID=1192854 RepID=A0A2Z2P5F7_9GAMM|nr:RNase adapter RapZ [Granulosicoccus antarcticus]ASJ75927.1 RNase adapter protein RapZ [Granulosicoccus antarcticus IMCC3135]
MTRLTIVTGLSGSGKSVALHTLEDEGFFCIDNLPSFLLTEFIDKLLASGSELYSKLAIGVDMRSERASADNLLKLLKELRARQDAEVEVLFLDTDRTRLVTRFSETRRKHPLSSQDLPLISAIDEEARLLEPVKDDAELVIDTSALNLHELRNLIRTYILGKTQVGLALTFQSFGFKHGTPASTDFMFDVRCLPNPHWEPDLRRFTGREKPIIKFLQEQPDVEDMFTEIRNYLQRWLPLFEAENRAYLTVSVGCTGGRHRSVYLVDRLADHFAQERNNVSRRHREL